MREAPPRSPFLGFVAALGVCFAASAAGRAATGVGLEDWYPGLTRPPGTPPDAAFAPVWTALYLLMAIAAWRVWLKAGWRHGGPALALFAVQLALNAAWPALFFALQAMALALAGAVALTAAVLATALAFHRLDPWAGWLMAPYAAWSGYAAYLNAGFWVLN